jgi:hypothetical protein
MRPALGLVNDGYADHRRKITNTLFKGFGFDYFIISLSLNSG